MCDTMFFFYCHQRNKRLWGHKSWSQLQFSTFQRNCRYRCVFSNKELDKEWLNWLFLSKTRSQKWSFFEKHLNCCFCLIKGYFLCSKWFGTEWATAQESWFNAWLKYVFFVGSCQSFISENKPSSLSFEFYSNQAQYPWIQQIPMRFV